MQAKTREVLAQIKRNSDPRRAEKSTRQMKPLPPMIAAATQRVEAEKQVAAAVDPKAAALARAAMEKQRRRMAFNAKKKATP